jgi:2-oxoglutarate dehydrogenase E2 component (dihydrolipoamide succinyltransferase)
MPAARKLADEHGVKTDDVAGSGRGGRVTKDDVVRHLDVTGGAKAAPAVAIASSAKTADVKPMPAPRAPVMTSPEGRTEKRVPMTRLRARIAERLVEAQHTAAILTTFNEVNMGPVMELRKKYVDKFEKQEGVKLGFMSFFVKAAVEALKRFPEVNASIDGSDIVYHGFYDIGIAVGSPRGLVVPILRDADQVSMADVEKSIKDFGERAKAGKLAIEEMTGGTFTITNGGIFGSLLSTPILNPPQSAILGMHKIQDRPMVENGQIVVRPMMYLALSYDHRIVDGREAVQFLVTIKDMLEDPARLVLGV